MTASLRLACLLILLSLASGCATTSWVKLEQPYTTAPDNSFTVDLPVGWVRAPTSGDVILVTRDGAGIQYIKTGRYNHKTAFPKIKKASKADMQPNELAELMIAELKASAGSAVEILSNQPTGVAGKIGVRLHVQTRTKEGLRYQMVLYGLVDVHGFYVLNYRAPVLHYFQRDLPTFEKTVQTFRLTGKKS